MTTSKPIPRAAELADVSDEVCREANELLSAAGSPEQAKRAVDSAVGSLAEPTSNNDAFALQCGFGSYLEMFEASKLIGERDGKHWFITNAGTAQFVFWNDHDLVISNKAESFEAALRLWKGVAPQRSDSTESPPQS